MKVLSLLQPWATLVVIGAKKIETRSWATQHRGELLIHASMGKSGALLAAEPPFTKYISNFNELPFGAIIGQVWLEEVIQMERLFLSGARINQLTLEEKAFGDYSPKRYAWMLHNPIQFNSPIPAKGSLNLWEYDGEINL